ncbi:TonB-dependent siderophore receptor [Novosphingobium sp. 1949]|uniref:TonB-dependent siderophore receptor n=1 Tax=Novosphingobium organovorum TaxID=2930092 RepID=A0ABT0BD15_9SPHN|nr:TonB-dependent siderophore receptor [Novosphingobium organovorum]MCJ2182953.1 TonB-dependent siderophore receptor [Novosphingobium organovorum]
MRFTSTSLRASLLAATALVYAGSTAAHAETDDSAPVEAGDTVTSADGTAITVKGQRQAYLGATPIKVLPQVVQTMDATTLHDAGITKLQTALDFVAGVSRQNNFGGMFDSYAIRGFSGDESQSSNYLLNGFNASRGYGGARDASNIERIEVIKGPTSALFGRGDPGGAVNIVTKQPYFEPGANFEFALGSYNNYRGQGDVNLPVTEDLAVRVTGAYDEGDSFRDYVHHRTITVTPSIMWNIDAATSLSYNFEFVDQRMPFDRGIVALDGDVYAVSRKTFMGEPGDGPIRTRSYNQQAQLQHDFDNNWSILLGAAYRTSSFKGYSTEAENAASRQPFFSDGTTLSRRRLYRDYSSTDLTLRGELSGSLDTAGITHNLQIGADWNYFTLPTVQNRWRPPSVASQTSLAAGNAINVYDPVYGNLPTLSALIDSDETDESSGVYVQDMIDITDWLKLRGGGRYDIFKQHVVNNLTGVISQQYKTAFSPQVGLSVLPTSALTLYASFGKGFRPNIGTDYASNSFEPERTTAYEVGAKYSAFGDRLLASLALFSMKKTNVLTADPAHGGFSLALGEARSKGVEFSVSGKLPAGFKIDLNYSYIDAENAKDATDPDWGYTLAEGDPLINIAKHSASLLLFKEFDVFAAKANLGLGVNYVGKRLGETGYRFDDGSFFWLPSYTLTRISGAISPTDHLKISGEVTNLFNEEYFTNSYSRVWLMPGAPRQFTVRVGYTF